MVNDVQVDDGGFSGTGIDADGDGINDMNGRPIVTNDARFNGFAVSLVEHERERIGGTAAVQYRPSRDFTLTVDGLYTSFTSPAIQYSYSYFPSVFNNDSTDNVLNGANQVISHTTVPFATDLVVRENAGDTETFAVGANAAWQILDELRFIADVSFSRSDGQRDNLGSAGGSGGFFVIGYPEGTFSQTGTGNRVPDVAFTAATVRGSPKWG